MGSILPSRSAPVPAASAAAEDERRQRQPGVDGGVRSSTQVVGCPCAGRRRWADSPRPAAHPGRRRATSPRARDADVRRLRAGASTLNRPSSPPSRRWPGRRPHQAQLLLGVTREDTRGRTAAVRKEVSSSASICSPPARRLPCPAGPTGSRARRGRGDHGHLMPASRCATAANTLARSGILAEGSPAARPPFAPAQAAPMSCSPSATASAAGPGRPGHAPISVTSAGGRWRRSNTASGAPCQRLTPPVVLFDPGRCDIASSAGVRFAHPSATACAGARCRPLSALRASSARSIGSARREARHGGIRAGGAGLGQRRAGDGDIRPRPPGRAGRMRFSVSVPVLSTRQHGGRAQRLDRSRPARESTWMRAKPPGPAGRPKAPSGTLPAASTCPAPAPRKKVLRQSPRDRRHQIMTTAALAASATRPNTAPAAQVAVPAGRGRARCRRSRG